LIKSLKGESSIMKRFLAIVLSAALGMAVTPSVTHAAGLPLILNTTVNYTQNTLTVNGQNFGSKPVVMLNNLEFPTVSSSSSEIVADFPSGYPPSSFTPGTYFLTVQYSNQLPSLFTAAIGMAGPQGPAGPAGATGAQGPQGPQGATGTAGAAGSMGPPGPMGPAGPIGLTGATGATGATGPAGPAGSAGAIGATGPQGPVGLTGATGAQGSAGPQGPQGPQGSQGPAGQNGTGVLTDSSGDTAVGLQALNGTIVYGYGTENTATGYQALYSNTQSYNTATGYQALYSNVFGSSNTANGEQALYSNTKGANNTATGTGALYSNTLGNANTATGAFALFSNTYGGEYNGGNTATGTAALYSNTTGDQNTATGSGALNANTTGGANTATGSGALDSNTTGGQNTAVGASALVSATTGSYNVAIGSVAGQNITTTSYNIDIGNQGVATDSGIVRIGDGGTNNTATYLSGAVYGQSFNPSSDANLKTDFRAVEPAAILASLSALPVQTWRFKNDANQTRHIGPTAQDFHSTFAVGDDDKHISVTDEGGVALVAAKALSEALRNSQADLEAQKALTADLQSKVSALQRTVDQLLAIQTPPSTTRRTP
jgi:hypothetical protein